VRVVHSLDEAPDVVGVEGQLLLRTSDRQADPAVDIRRVELLELDSRLSHRVLSPVS